MLEFYVKTWFRFMVYGLGFRAGVSGLSFSDQSVVNERHRHRHRHTHRHGIDTTDTDRHRPQTWRQAQTGADTGLGFRV